MEETTFRREDCAFGSGRVKKDALIQTIPVECVRDSGTVAERESRIEDWPEHVGGADEAKAKTNSHKRSGGVALSPRE